MSRVLTFLATAALLLVGLAIPVPAQAADPVPTTTTEDHIQWDPQPTVAWLGPNLRLTMTMATYLYDGDGVPMSGANVGFTLLAPYPAFPMPATQLSIPVCDAVADANGLATCKGGGFVGSTLSLLTNGAYATFMQGPFHTEANTKLPVVRFR